MFQVGEKVVIVLGKYNYSVHTVQTSEKRTFTVDNIPFSFSQKDSKGIKANCDAFAFAYSPDMEDEINRLRAVAKLHYMHFERLERLTLEEVQGILDLIDSKKGSAKMKKGTMPARRLGT